MRLIFVRDKIALVQKALEGRDYRVVVLDDKVISAYERIPLNVVGDGKSSIKTLLWRKQKQFVLNDRDTQIKMTDFRIVQKLKRQDLSLRSVLKRNERIFLLDNANLSSGGDSIDVTRKIHPEFKKLSIRLTRDMGLRLCGVDLLVSGDIEDEPKKYSIIETNAAPGLDHYVRTGRRQREIVEKMYTRVLRAIE